MTQPERSHNAKTTELLRNLLAHLAEEDGHEADLETKLCERCKEDKELSHFSKRSNSPDGRQSWCKECLREYHRAKKRTLKSARKIGIKIHDEHVELMERAAELEGTNRTAWARRTLVNHARAVLRSFRSEETP